MNDGIIASRYAKALLKYVQEAGSGKQVYSQACILVARMTEIPQLKEYLVNASDVSLERKLSLMSSALPAPVEPAMVNFLKMVTARHRLDSLPRMLLSFIEQYRRANGIKVGKLVTAVPMEGLRERLEGVFHEKTGAEIHLDEKTDSAIIGGFVFELEDCRVDASVEGQLRRIRRQLVEKNNRIV